MSARETAGVTLTTPLTGDLLYSDVEDDLRASVRAVLEKHSPWDDVLARTESAVPTHPGSRSKRRKRQSHQSR